MLQLVVTDTETTGTEDCDQVVEVATDTLVHDGNGWVSAQRWQTLVRPTVGISWGALATHHITPAMLREERDMATLLEKDGLAAFRDPQDVVFVAHFAEFDRRLLTQSGVVVPERTICTWRCAQHIWPDAPGHSNQVLRYWLGLDVDRDLGALGLPPHRAMPDVIVTAALLVKMLETRSVGMLEVLTLEPIIHNTVRFGMHQGKAWADVPPGYLQWILREGEERVVGGQKKGFDRDTRATAQHYLSGAHKKAVVAAVDQPPQNLFGSGSR